MNDIVESNEGGREIAQQSEGNLQDGAARFALLREALTNPEVQPEKAIAMADLMFRIEDRDRHSAFIEAKVACIAAMPRIGKDGQNTHTKTRYAKWETMQPIITPILHAHGLALNFDVGDEDGRVTVTPILSGHGWEERGGTRRLPVDVGKGRNEVQAHVGSSSYGKRDAAKAMLNLVEGGVMQDDDGNAGGGTAMDAYEQLDANMRELVDLGRRTAAEGMEHYENWFKELKPAERGFLNFNTAWPAPVTWHQRNKDLAAKV